MAVTVQRQTPSVVLDDEDRIVGVGSAAESQFGPLAGSVVWECFPGAEPLFRPYYDAVRDTGEPVEFVQFYAGRLVRVTARPVDAGLEVAWRLLGNLDTTTFASFRKSFVDVVSLLDAEGCDAERKQARSALRLIEGGR